MAGPNGQGVVSTPASLCAQIVAPYPPAGRIGVASQSGNFVSSFLNLARSTGVGISRAVSAGNAAAVSVADYLDFYADDPATSVGLAYIEGVADGAALMRGSAGQRLASRWSCSRAARRRAGHGRRRATPERWQPTTSCSTARAGRTASPGRDRSRRRSRRRPRSPRSRCRRDPTSSSSRPPGDGGSSPPTPSLADRDLRLLELPDDLLAAIDEHLPARWSRNNPVDCAGGETRDTIPTVWT